MEIRIGIILPVDDDRPFAIQKVLPSIWVALQSSQVRKLLPNCTFILHSMNSKCNAIAAPLAAFQLMDVKKVHVLFGPVCDYSLAPVARYSPFWNVPVITPGGIAADFDINRGRPNSEYKMLTRMGINMDNLANVTLSLLNRFKWNSVKILYSDYGFSEVISKFCYLAVSAIKDTLSELLNVDDTKLEQHEEAEDLSKLLLEHVGNEFSIIILCNSPDTIRELMLIAHDLNFDSGEYVFINIDPLSNRSMLSKPWYREGDTDEMNDAARKAFETVLTISLKTFQGPNYKTFSNMIKQKANHFFSETVFTENEEVNVFVPLFYDAALLYAHALNESSPADYIDPSNGAGIHEKMKNKTIKGLTGNVVIDHQNDRSVEFSILDMDPESGIFKEVGVFCSIENKLMMEKDQQIHWGGGNPYEVPSVVPRCGHNNALCPEEYSLSTVNIIIISLVLTTITITLITGIIYYKESQVKRQDPRLDWRIKWDDIYFDTQDKRRFEHHNSIFKSSMSSLLTYDSFSFNHLDDMFVKIGSYKGSHVAIRKLTRPVTLTKQLTNQLKTMKNLLDDHIVRFIGLCLDPPNMCIIMEHCHKRTLKDLLSNEEVNLDTMFKYSLIQDIVMGMAYIHGTDIHSHGNLNTNSCVVDSRFVLKITNFGLHCLTDDNYKWNDNHNCTKNKLSGNLSVGSQKNGKALDMLNNLLINNENVGVYAKNFQEQLWVAPELLRNPRRPKQGTQKGDMYSFAIICQEILYRRGPFWIENDNHTILELISLVKDGMEPYTRPTLVQDNQEGFNSELVDLISRCWSEIPSKRPDFNSLKWQLKRCLSSGVMGKVSGTSLLDNILSRLEQYAQYLEKLVEEKTSDYLDQKRKAEEILYRLLPRQVADELMINGTVEAEKFECVTICFCDICGFTALSAASSPMEIVTMLNDLYTKFDALIDKFDVYKVETIGDAYMVVSGLVSRTNPNHAVEISKMSLSLLEVVKGFQIIHMPNQQLKLRTGVHSGPVCAGVVGMKMPRYCLFGDTVNTSITVQSMADPLTILVSNQTKVILDKCNEFNLIEKGPIQLPSKSTVMTWRLLGLKSVRNVVWSVGDNDTSY